MTMQTIRRAAALGALAALILAIGSPRDAAAHGETGHVFYELSVTTSQSSVMLDICTTDDFVDHIAEISRVQIGIRPPGGAFQWKTRPAYHSCDTDGFTRLAAATTYTVGIRVMGADGVVLGEQTATARTLSMTPHTHPYAPVAHSHSDLTHGHPFARAGHTHATGAHSHSYAATGHAHTEVPEHAHTIATGATPPAASQPAASTCPRFIELVSPWTYRNGQAREHVTGSVWIAVHAIEYMRERTVPIIEGARNGSDEVEGVELRLMEAHAARDGSAGRGRDEPRAFILDGANLADVAASVRCQSAPVAVTTEDPPAPGTE